MPSEELLQKMRQYATGFTKELPPENVIHCDELWKLMSESDEYILLVDTRSDEEMNVSRITGAISYSEYLERLDNENFPFVKTICYSTIGKRSCDVVKELIKKGVKAFCLEGGLIEWCNSEHGELVDSKGNPTHLVHVFNPDYRPLFNSSYVCVY